MDTKLTVYSTTGTAPLEFVRSDRPGEVFIYLEDGSGQAYSVANLARALAALTGEAG